MTDKYAELRVALPELTAEARSVGGVNSRAQMIIDLLTERDALREWQRQMVEKAAAQSLDGYRELGAKVAERDAEIERLREALNGMLALDEEHHQRYPGDDDVCTEVRAARAALAGDDS